MANPLDREIERALRKGREPEAWKRRGAKKENVIDQRGDTGQARTGNKAPENSGMNRPGHPR